MMDIYGANVSNAFISMRAGDSPATKRREEIIFCLIEWV
jgi:hypothetical protein